MTFYASHDKSKQEDGFEIDFHAKAGHCLVRNIESRGKIRYVKTGITQKRFSVLYNRAKAEILTEIENEKASILTLNELNKVIQ